MIYQPSSHNASYCSCILRKNTRTGGPITMNNTPLDDVTEFTYLGSIITKDGDCTMDINARISKARQSFEILKTYGNEQVSKNKN